MTDNWITRRISIRKTGASNDAGVSDIELQFCMPRPPASGVGFECEYRILFDGEVVREFCSGGADGVQAIILAFGMALDDLVYRFPRVMSSIDERWIRDISRCNP